jgi:hypothetical protein
MARGQTAHRQALIRTGSFADRITTSQTSSWRLSDIARMRMAQRWCTVEGARIQKFWAAVSEPWGRQSFFEIK